MSIEETYWKFCINFQSNTGLDNAIFLIIFLLGSCLKLIIIWLQCDIGLIT